MTRHQSIAALAGVIALATGTAPAIAADFPTRPITMIVPAAPGGPQDIIARILSEGVQQKAKYRIVVENRPGQGGQLGLQLTAQASPDGYTLGIAASNIAALEIVGENWKLDPFNDFSHVIRIAGATRMLIASAQSPFKTLEELLAYAKANPGKVNFGDLGGTNTLDFALFTAMAGVRIAHVPYSGSSAKVQAALATGEVDLALDTLSGARTMLDQQKTRVLGVGSASRDAVAPNAPAIAERVPGYQASGAWYGIFGPAKIPADIVAKLYADMKAAIDDPATRQRIEGLGLRLIGGDGREMQAQIKIELENFRDAAKRSGYKRP
jgi:tripartite-type tricarboxylate transporter receptor subunit TctC